ncbi:MAG: large protein, partial [Verrucomicrobiales bacterium]|nr:large protein [Verrucomicrobiales bacterium]
MNVSVPVRSSVKTLLSALFCLVIATFSAKAIIATNSQLLLGNPSGAITDPNNHNHYLLQRTVEALDYSDKLGQPNWASWDLTAADVGSSGRSSSFFPDTNLPSSFTNKIGNGTFGGGYDRGHMCPSADRTDNTTDNDLVFYMSNIIPQASGNNQGPWADLENYTRTLLTTSECMIVSGPYDFSSGAKTANSTSKASIAIPNWTWKTIVVAPLGAGSVTNRITASTRVITIKMTNSTDVNYTYGTWPTYITNAHQIEVDTGFKFFTGLDTNIAEVLRWRIDGAAAPNITTFTPPNASVGSTVTITGANFTRASWVIFNNAYTTNFVVNSSSSISVTVPATASSGLIKVIAPGGLATSGSTFTVGSPGRVLITSQPSSISSNAGTTANFAVQATGNGTLSYQWNRNAAPLSNGGSFSGATTTILTITGVGQSNAGSYTCVVTNSTSTATSSVATLTVIDAPQITTQPSSTSVNAGTAANFNVVATGTSPTYKWRKNAVGLSDTGNVSGSATAALTISSTSSSDIASYSVIVSNAAGTVTSVDATLAVASVPTISAQPQNATAAIGATAYFSATASGAPLIYQWRKNAVALSDGGDFAGTTTSILTVSPVAVADVASYSVVIGNSAGTTTSASATLTLSGTVAITSQPSSQAVTAGSDATFTVTATGSGTLGYQWRFNGASIVNATNSSYTRASVSGADAGTYAVVVTNSFSSATSSDAVLSVVVGSTSILAQWNMNDISVTNSPVPSLGSGTAALIGGTTATFAAGGTTDTNSVNNGWNTTSYPAPGGANKSAGVQFTVSSAGYENVRFAWDQRNSNTGSKYVRLQYTTNGTTWIDSNVNTMSNTSFVTVSNNLSATTGVRNNANLAFRVVAEYQNTTGLGTTNDFVAISGTYGSGGTIRFDMVTVYGDALISPTIVSQPQSQTKNAGDTATFNVTPSGSAPFTYKWRRNGSPLADSGNISGSATSVLTVATVGAGDVASYSVIVSNSVGSATSANATLVVNLPPSITTQPTSRTNVTGSTATLTVTAAGTALQYQWRKGGSVLSNGGNILGAITSALTITGATATDAGSYSVDVSNSVNVVSSTAATLTVVDPPSITAGPTSATVNAGDPAMFAVAANGTPPLSFQWRRNGTLVSGATDSAINISNAQQINAGSYDVVVTNAGGSATSSAAVLMVLDPPAFTAQPVSQTAFAGADIIFNVSVTGAAPFTYKWRQDGENLVDAGNITGSQTPSLTLHNVHDADNGAYSVVVQNTAGSATSSDGALTVVPFANRLLNITTNLNGTPALLWSVVAGDS